MIKLRTIEGFVQIIDGPIRHLLRGPHGRFGGLSLEVFPTAEAARNDPWPEVLGIAQVQLGVAETKEEWPTLRSETSLIVIMESRGGFNSWSRTTEVFYDLYGAMPPGGPANTTLHASYLGTNGIWRPFKSFAAAKACADEVVRQGRARPLIATFSLTRL